MTREQKLRAELVKVKQKKESKEARRCAAKLLLISRALERVDADNVISRRDNTVLFELTYKLQAIARRIRDGYPDTNY